MVTADAPVKLDQELKAEIEAFLAKGKNRFEYPSVKNFVDKAVLKMLHEVKDKENTKHKVLRSGSHRE